MSSNGRLPIEKGVPLPLRKKHDSRYDWENMEIGDSIFVPDGKAKSLGSCAYSWSRRNHVDWGFTVREEGEGCRIWRTR